MPRVSVIIPTYNAARYLSEAIDSVFAQTYSDHEIIVIDDGSTDQTAAVLNHYGSRIYSIWQANQGQGAARNAGIVHAQGEFLAFLDADDLFLPSKLEIQVNYLERHSELAVVYSDGMLFRIAPSGLEKQRLFSACGYLDRHLSESPGAATRLLFHNGFPVHAALVRHRAVEAAGGFDATLVPFEDWDLWQRIAESYEFGYLEAIVAKYRVSDINSSHNRRRVYQVDNELKQKFLNSRTFTAMPSSLQADYWYHWGMTALMISRPDLASERFAEAIRLNSTHLLARTAGVFTKVLGRNFGLMCDVVYRLGRSLKSDPFARGQ